MMSATRLETSRFNWKALRAFMPQTQETEYLESLELFVSQKRPILPDYTKSTKLVYREAVAAAIQEDLAFTYTQWPVAHKTKDMPPWMPNLNMKGDRWMHNHIKPSRGRIYELMSTTFSYLPLAEFHNASKTIHAGGVSLGVVQELTDAYTGLEEQYSERLTAQSLHSCFTLGACAKDYSEPTTLFTDTRRFGLTLPGGVRHGDIIAGLFGVNFSLIIRSRGQLGIVERYEMIGHALLNDHTLGHPSIPKDTEEAELYSKHGFRTFVIDCGAVSLLVDGTLRFYNGGYVAVDIFVGPKTGLIMCYAQRSLGGSDWYFISGVSRRELCDMHYSWRLSVFPLWP